MFQQTGGPRGSGISGTEQQDVALLLSYRFLRIGIVVATVMLIVSVLVEIIRVDGCVRDSISAYFYSPARTIFTGALIAVGLGLVVLQGDGDFEEVALNLAGLWAPMVAIIPPGVSVACDARFDGIVGEDAIDAKQAEILELVKPGLLNNLIAYFGVALAAIALLAIFARQFTTQSDRVTRMRAALLVYAVVVVVWAVGAYLLWLDRASWAHMLSAVAMFVAFAAVVMHNGWRRAPVPDWYRVWCRRILYGMAIAAVVWGALIAGPFDVRWAVFGLEMSELLLFAAFWVMQTAAFWERDVVTGTRVPVTTER
jgi:hypothetical protein